MTAVAPGAAGRTMAIGAAGVTGTMMMIDAAGAAGATMPTVPTGAAVRTMTMTMMTRIDDGRGFVTSHQSSLPTLTPSC
jgi:hypothetical protein